MGPVVTRLSNDFDGRALVGTVDVTAHGTLTGRYGVSAVPTFVFFKNGSEASRLVGATTYEELAGRLQTLLASP